MKTALIIGVSGQDGAYLARHLLGLGYAVYGTSRGDAVPENLVRLGVAGRVAMRRLDPCDGRATAALLAGQRFDEIYALSGQSSVGRSFEAPGETFRSIADSTMALLEAVRGAKERPCLFFAGSAECFGEHLGEGAEIGDAFHPGSPYGAAKAASFWLVDTFRAAYGMDACTGILFNHESPLRPDGYVSRKVVKSAVAIARGQARSVTLGTLDVERDWGWAPEYVEAMHLMLQRERLKDFIIATGRPRSLRDFVACCFAAVGLDWTDHVTLSPELVRPVDARRSAARVDKTRSELGWQARTGMEELARKLVECEWTGSWG